MNIQHNPIYNRDLIIKHYSERDGVPIKYVCTSALGGEEFAMDIFYRDTPHPEFGNRYFGLYMNRFTEQVMITNADAIEGQTFAMVEDLNGDLVYSQHRHDFRMMKNGNMIDGGRAYVRANGMIHSFEVKDGELVEMEE
jgi:hypothetical protein